MMIRLIPFVIALLVACTGSAEAPSAPAPEAAAPEAAAVPEAPPAAAPAALKVVSVTSGDAACYVELATAAGVATTYSSDFELCPGGGKDATALVGKNVTATFEKISVQSPECQGDPECKKTVEVEGVQSLTPQ